MGRQPRDRYPAATAGGTLMLVQWASKASTDVVHLQVFLTGVSPSVAAHIVKSLVAAPAALVASLRIGPSYRTSSHARCAGRRSARTRCATRSLTRPSKSWYMDYPGSNCEVLVQTQNF